MWKCNTHNTKIILFANRQYLTQRFTWSWLQSDSYRILSFFQSNMQWFGTYSFTFWMWFEWTFFYPKLRIFRFEHFSTLTWNSKWLILQTFDSYIGGVKFGRWIINWRSVYTCQCVMWTSLCEAIKAQNRWQLVHLSPWLYTVYIFALGELAVVVWLFFLLKWTEKYNLISLWSSINESGQFWSISRENGRYFRILRLFCEIFHELT